MHLARSESFDSLSDAHLLGLTREGSDAAFETILYRYWQPLLRHMVPMVGADSAEDVVQTTFIKAYTAIHSGVCSNEVRGWLHRVAHNGAVDVLRERSRKRVSLVEPRQGPEAPDSVFERTERLRDVLTIINSLPARQREALVRRELAGASYDDIAGQMGTSSSAVRQLLLRARETLRSSAAALVPWGLLGRLPGASESGGTLASTGVGSTGTRLGTAACTIAVAACAGSAPAPAPNPPEARTGQRAATSHLESEPPARIAAVRASSPRSASRPVLGVRPRRDKAATISPASAVDDVDQEAPAPAPPAVKRLAPRSAPQTPPSPSIPTPPAPPRTDPAPPPDTAPLHRSPPALPLPGVKLEVLRLG